MPLAALASEKHTWYLLSGRLVGRPEPLRKYSVRETACCTPDCGTVYPRITSLYICHYTDLALPLYTMDNDYGGYFTW